MSSLNRRSKRKTNFLTTFSDSKMFLSLYGHSQPVLCLDISFDSRLVITGSSDRNIKIWGLDFGDCHRSLFAHDNTVTAVQFVPKTHLFFSAGKDNQLKYWDADKFLHIQTLNVRRTKKIFSFDRRKMFLFFSTRLGSLWRDSFDVDNE